MQLVQKLVVAATGIAMSFVTIQPKPAQATSLNLSSALTATGVDKAWNQFGVNGSGIKIGVISTSFNTVATHDQFGNLDTYGTDVANGFLPSGVQVLQDNNGTGATDEGRAMLELIHAIAPGASLAFASATTATTPTTANDILASFGKAILDLKVAGANIIVDDIGIYNSGAPQEPNPPDGAVNQAIESVFNQGVSYFTSAGNDYTNYSIFGHRNSPYALTEGAVYYGNSLLSPDEVTRQGEVEKFSSSGDTTLRKPDVVAPDGLDISFNLDGKPPWEPPIDSTTGFYSFFGTSAAAPFTAAVAALLLQADPNASPNQIYSALRDTAQPLDTPGFNKKSGYGLIQADQAIAALNKNFQPVGLNPKSVPESSSYVGIVVAFGIGLLLKRKVAIS